MNFKVNLFFFQLLDPLHPLHPLDKKFACTTDPPPLQTMSKVWKFFNGFPKMYPIDSGYMVKI